MDIYQYVTVLFSLAFSGKLHFMYISIGGCVFYILSLVALISS